MRISDGVARAPSFAINVDGATVTAYPGETVATAMLAAGVSRFRDDNSGAARGLWCNMGSCGECYVRIGARRVRACLALAEPGMMVSSHG